MRGGCFIGHGRSTALGVRNGVRRAVEFCNHAVHEKIREQMALIHREEAAVLGGGAVEAEAN